MIARSHVPPLFQPIPCLDGLRGIAVLSVVLFHAGLWNGGWIGVPLFFVLSGYLITRGLLRTRDGGALPYFRRFFTNRILRIFPLYFTTIMIIAILSRWMTMPGTNEGQLTFATFFILNLFPAITKTELTGTLIHFWSLAVEEQFYLIWPVIVYRAGGPQFTRLLWALVLAAPLARWFVVMSIIAPSHQTTLQGQIGYMLPSSHLDTLGLGALLAAAERSGTIPATRRYLACLTIAMIAVHLTYTILWCGSSVDQSLTIDIPEHLIATGSHVWGLSVLAAFFGFVVASAIMITQQPTGRAWRFLTNLGTISYGVYVIHVPVRELLGTCLHLSHGLSGRLILFITYAPLSYLLALISFRWIEAPFLRMKQRAEG